MKAVPILGLLFAVLFGLFALTELTTIEAKITETGGLGSFIDALPMLALAAIITAMVASVVGVSYVFFRR